MKRAKLRDKVKELRSTFLLGLATLFVAVSIPVLTPSSALAYSAGNAWIHFNDVMCTGGGVVNGIYWANDNYSSGPAGGDWGDRTIYPRVRVGSGSYNTLSFTIMCKRWGWQIYKAGDGQKNLSPYENNLTYHYSTYF
jgi:hypothetical protein